MKEHPRSHPQDSARTLHRPQVPVEILRACPQLTESCGDPAGEIYGSDTEEIRRRYGRDTEELPAFSTFFTLIIGVVQQPPY
jgi:hypothetical protein